MASSPLKPSGVSTLPNSGTFGGPFGSASRRSALRWEHRAHFFAVAASLMAVYLTDTHTRLKLVGAAVNETQRKRGDVQAITAVKHTVENIGKSGSEVVVVEFKNPPMKSWSAGARDAVKLDPKHYMVVAENDYARALRSATGRTRSPSCTSILPTWRCSTRAGRA